MKDFQKGFTLIELMVVISIIGLLSSIVLASLQTARTKARNSRIVQEVQQLRNQIELTRSGDTYPSLMRSNSSGVASARFAMHTSFTSYPGITALVTDILKQNNYAAYPAGYVASSIDNLGSPICGTRYNLVADANNGLSIFVDTPVIAGDCGAATKYAIYALMDPTTAPGSGYFCIDSLGRTTRTATGYIPISSGGTSVTCQ